MFRYLCLPQHRKSKERRTKNVSIRVNKTKESSNRGKRTKKVEKNNTDCECVVSEKGESEHQLNIRSECSPPSGNFPSIHHCRRSECSAMEYGRCQTLTTITITYVWGTIQQQRKTKEHQTKNKVFKRFSSYTFDSSYGYNNSNEFKRCRKMGLNHS